MPTEKRKKSAEHPGQILLHDFLIPNGISQSEFADHIGSSWQRLNEIVNGHRSVTPETAWLLAQALNTEPMHWLMAQAARDLEHAKSYSVERLI